MKNIVFFFLLFNSFLYTKAQIISLVNYNVSSNNIKNNQFIPKKNSSITRQYENWFHIGIGASGFTYFLWTTDINSNPWINTKAQPYIGFSYMPELTIQLGNRISYYLSIGWTGMSEFYNMYHDKQANTIPPTKIGMTPVVGMTGISFGIFGYEGEEEIGYNKARDIYFTPARLSIGTGFGNFRWDNGNNYVSGVVGVISIEWYIFLLNFG